mmetsp:Transcript_7466/g.12453  ORF Transcript_7466/g.12453 Transcript_7466/m.12453 type:complete len:395 (+) Transcript_7466:166-1350(+)
MRSIEANLDSLPLLHTLPESYRLLCFDGLRGICSVIIVAGHLLTYWVPVEDEAFAARFPFLALEYLTEVSLFFLISGFTLVHVYDPTGDAFAFDSRVFFWKRAGRLLPVYYLSLFISLPALLVYHDIFAIITSIVFSVLCLQSLSVVGNDLNGPLWQVSSFVICYLSFPRLLRRLRTLSTSILLFLLGALYLLPVLCMILWLKNLGLGSFIIMHISTWSRLPQFIIGMGTALVARRVPLKSPSVIADSVSCLLLINKLACTLLMERARPDFGFWFFYMYVCEYALVPLQALWLSALANPSCGGLTVALLTTRPVLFLGRISYTVYCLHWPLIIWIGWAFKGIIPQRNLYGLVGWFAFPPLAIMPILLVVLCIAALVCWLIEEPSRRAIEAQMLK